MNIRILCVAALAVHLGGCATVTRGTTEQMQFTSEPPGATMRTSLGHTCATPCTLSIARSDEFVASFQAEGYEPADVPVRTTTTTGGAAGLAGNVLIGGVVGLGVDAYTGAHYSHDPNPVHAILRPRPAPPPEPATKVKKPAPVLPGPRRGVPVS